MKKLFAIVCLMLAIGSVKAGDLVMASKDTILMGSAFSLTAVHQSEALAWTSINAGIAEISRIERLISSWESTSETSLINDNAGIKPVVVSAELFDLIERSLKISQLSNGYFDISFASINKVWDFNSGQTTIPTEELLAASVSKINYKNIVLDRATGTVFLKETGMRIGFGAIGKGYAADKAKLVMENLGIKSGVVNAGGDLVAWGTKIDGSLWSIGIADPNHKGEVLSWIDISDQAVVTSGNYERYIDINGKRYCHIINPKTGWPVSGLKSVTIITKQGEIADALATTVFVLGETEGLALINHLDGVECIIINDAGDLSYSKNITLNLLNND